jgi:hypothetical protein
MFECHCKGETMVCRQSFRCLCCNKNSMCMGTLKIVSNVLLSRLGLYIDEIIGDHQCGFRRNRSTTGQIFCIVHQLFSTMRQYISYS